MTVYAFPGYVPDVVALSGRAEASWANALRDRANQVFSTKAALVAGVVSPQVGQQGIVTADGTNDGVWVYSGATVGWTRPWNLPWGLIARTKSTADQTNADSSEHEITALATAFTVVTNRIYRINLRGGFTSGTTSSQNLILRIKDNTTTIEESSIQRMPTDTTALTAVFTHQVETSSLTAGAHTVRVTQQASNSAGVVARGSTTTLIVTVDDIGPSGAPS